MPSFSRGVLFLLVLLIAALPLYCSATLDAEERQKEQEERDATTEDARKADMAPEPPQELKVDVQSEVAVLLTWNKPSDTAELDHFLVYMEGEDLEDTTESTFYIWDDLEACTNYTFGVRSVSAVGDMSDPVLGDGRTDVGRPPPPQSLHGESESSTSMTLTWDKPDTPCDIEYYRVKWSLDASDSQSTQVTETSYTVTDLLPKTTYILSVSATTTVAEGDAATIQETTAEDDGGPPEDLKAEGVSTSAINVSWSPPPNNPPQYYTVQGLPCMYLEEKVFELSYPITGLGPCTSCSIVVTSMYESGLKFQASTLGETLGGDPPPPKSCFVEVQDGYPTVSWEAPDTHCNLGIYNVLWTSTKLWGDGDEGGGSGNTSATQYRITEPVPYSDYSFEISASIDGDFGSPASCSGTSNEALPGPPVILSVVSEQGAAVVTWETPAEENGVIVNYGIFVDGGTDPVTQVSGEEHTARVEYLQPCMSVGLAVKARNGAGWGSSSEVEYMTVDGDDPPPPKICSVEVQYDFLTVSWVAPDSDCDLGEYNVLWTSTKLWGDRDEGSGSVNTSATQYLISYPAPYSDYRFEISSSIDGVFGMPAFCSGTSHETLPGPPVIQSVVSEQGAAVVTWETPAEENGHIVNYGIFVDGGTDPVTQVSGDEHTARVEGLETCMSVRLAVKALNGAGWGSSFEVEYVSVDGDGPPPPEICSVEVQYDFLTASWVAPDSECALGKYNVLWTSRKLWGDGGEGSGSVNTSATQYLISYPAPYSDYRFEISSSIDGVFGRPAYCSGTSHETLPGPPVILSAVSEQGAAVVTWETPAEENGVIVKYGIFVDGGTDPVTQVSGEEHTARVEGLEPCLSVGLAVKARSGAGWGSSSEVEYVTVDGDGC